MKNTTMKKITLIAAISLLILFIAACTLSVDDGTITLTLSNYTGKAVNVKAAGTTTSYWKVSNTSTETIEGATVNIYGYDKTTGTYSTTVTKTTTVGSDGTFTFASLEPNKYKLVGTKTDWTFVPRYVEITGSSATFPDLMAYQTAAAGQITIITSWKNTTIDVDSILTYGTDADVVPTDWTDAVKNPAPGARTKIDWDSTGTTAGIKLDRDI